MTLVGFVHAYPRSASTPPARSAIDLAVSVFDIYGNGFAVAAGAASIVRDLRGKVDFLAKEGQVSYSVSNFQQTADVMAPVGNVGESDQPVYTDNDYLVASSVNLDLGAYTADNELNLFDIALSVDFWGDLDIL
jgi:hypothetical protein